MSDKPMIPAAQYTLIEGFGVCLAMCQRALAEVRALARVPGPPGEAGPEGKPGQRGERGEPGRNAADLDYLQDMIEQRVARAIRAASVTTSDGGRTLRWAIGDAVHEIKTAIVLDAGVWKEGASYAAGDGVTLGGSFFIAQTATTAKPGKSDDWRLAVKRGSDGRDFRSDEKRVLEPVRFK